MMDDLARPVDLTRGPLFTEALFKAAQDHYFWYQQHNRKPLSGAQAGIWFAQQLDPENPIYNTAEYVEIKGPLDQELFEKALRHVIKEAESFHARFGEDQDLPGN
ncbi:hypothetical protein DT075_06980 [Bacillus licheniformis]|nr:hypothetical protein DT075_06980 [Bacillus licheniformis]